MIFNISIPLAVFILLVIINGIYVWIRLSRLEKKNYLIGENYVTSKSKDKNNS